MFTYDYSKILESTGVPPSCGRAWLTLGMCLSRPCYLAKFLPSRSKSTCIYVTHHISTFKITEGLKAIWIIDVKNGFLFRARFFYVFKRFLFCQRFLFFKTFRPKKKFVVSGNPTDPSFYPPTLKILWTYLC